MSSARKPPVDLELLTSLAKRFSDREMFEEAAELFQLALRFDPSNLGVRLNLAQVHNQKKQLLGISRRDTEETLREELRRSAIDSSHFFGLAYLYEARGKEDLALECLEIARSKKVLNPYVHKLQGKISFRRRRYEEARDELVKARRYNPFDAEIAELLGRVEYERESYLESLEATVDAYLLIAEIDRGEAQRLTRRIRKLKTLRGLSSDDLQEVFHQRQDLLQIAFDRLDLQRERYLHEAAEPEPAAGRPRGMLGGRLELAQRLRLLEAWENLDDEQVFCLTRAVDEEHLPAGERIFGHGATGSDIFLLQRGEVAIRRATSYGDFELARIGTGEIFGEANFISPGERSGDAVTTRDCHLFRLDARRLMEVIGERPDLGLQLYLSFWHSLAHKLRGANDELKKFFAADAASESFLELRRRVEAEALDVGSEAKAEVLREQGLSADELTTLARFSNVKRYPNGTYLCREGEHGTEMYVVLEGKVMISKFIPGGGEEALAILGRGDFFGEMSLLDGAPRSADAKAFEGPVTVVVFDDRMLSEVMAMEPRVALDFMVLLCRLVCDRLREIDEKLITWRILAGEATTDGEQALADAPAGKSS